VKQYRCASRQRGFAMIAMLALAALVTAYLIALALSPDAAGQVIEREQRNMNALREAKAALIAYAASEQWQKYRDATTTYQPGALPCPDSDGDGDSDGALCANGPRWRIGRLPYKTIGSRDLTDATGERLWYAVSSNFYKNSAFVINSDTPGLLTVAGTAPVTGVAAIVFAPGPPIRDPITGQIQDRSAATPLREESYLEGFAPAGNDWTFTTNALPSETLNDRLIVITQAELMAAVEPTVAALIERDIKPYITQSYPNADPNWSGGYPFAVPWATGKGQSQNTFKGNIGTARGLMPVTRDMNAGFVEWDPASVTIVDYDALDDPGMGGDLNGPVNCGASTPGELSCLVDYTGRPGIRLRATLLNAGRAFLRPPSKADTTLTEFGGGATDWSGTISPNPNTIDNQLGLPTAGHARVSFYGRLRAGTVRPITIRVAVPPFHSISDPADPQSGWFIANRWYDQTYYAVSTGWIPGGGTGCGAGDCLTVSNLPAPFNNGRLILVFSGRPVAGQTRPSPNRSDYFELENDVPDDVAFQHHRWGLPTTINDRVVAVAP
jgi:hypothetical protein